ncbi:MAG: hypothetical protein OHK0021_21290 [Bryobacter sp.]
MKQILLIAALCLPLLAQGPDPKTSPTAASAATLYNMVAGNIAKSIEKMPAEKFSFKATDTVMPFSEFVGHLIDANNNFCGTVTGDPRPASMRKETDKAKLMEGWKAAMAKCQKAWAMTTDESLGKMVKMGNAERAAAFPMLLNVSHNFEHYGNLVTYMRMNGMVPPSSEGR